MADLFWFEARKTYRAASDKIFDVDRQANRPERQQHRAASSEITCIRADHRKILRAVQKKPLDLRQNTIKVEPIQWAKRPTNWIGRFDQGKGCSGFQYTLQLSGKNRMLLGIECLEAKCGNRKLGGVARKVGFQHVGAKMGNAVFPIFVQPVNCLPVHSRADVNGRDVLHERKSGKQMWPRFACSRHQIYADSRCFSGQVKAVYAGAPPRTNDPKRRDRAPVAVGTRASVKDTCYKIGIVNVITHASERDGTIFGMQGVADVH